MFDIDLRSRKPIYNQLINQIKMMIIQNVLETDEKLPAVNALAREITINPNTIQKAYRELESEGYIYSVQGKGRFVSNVQEAVDGKKIHELTEDLEIIVKELRSLGVSTDDLKAGIDKLQDDAGEGNGR